MEKFYFIGVDVSKKKLDFCVLSEGKAVLEETVANHFKSVLHLLRELESEHGVDASRALVCAEHTGGYTFQLAEACEASGYPLWLENAAQIKYSSGVQRSKSDKVDARRIAAYASRFRDKARLWERPSAEIGRLRQLESERSLYVSDLGKYKGQLRDQGEHMPKALYERKAGRLRTLIRELERTVAAVSFVHRKEGELKRYYERKVAEGKNKMSVINALRAKIVARMFAVIKRNEFYSPILT